MRSVGVRSVSDRSPYVCAYVCARVGMCVYVRMCVGPPSTDTFARKPPTATAPRSPVPAYARIVPRSPAYVTTVHGSYARTVHGRTCDGRTATRNGTLPRRAWMGDGVSDFTA